MAQASRNAYRPLAVGDAYPQRVERESTLYPLMGWPRTSGRGKDEPWRKFIFRDTVFKSLKLQDLWEKRLWELSECGWRYLPPATHRDGGGKGEQAYNVMKNCWPAFYIPVGSVDKAGNAKKRWGNPCRRPFCPNCYARQVKDLWVRVDAAMFGGVVDDPDKRRPRNKELDLAVAELTQQIPASTDSACPFFNFLRFALQDDAKAVFGKANVLGGVQQVVIEPQPASRKKDAGPPAGWIVRVRGLRIAETGSVPERQNEDKELCTGRHVARTIHQQPTRKEVVSIVSKLLRYPTQLIRGNPHLAARVSDASFYYDLAGCVKQWKFVRTFGCVRGGKPKKEKA